jgi:hypothetical protein
VRARAEPADVRSGGDDVVGRREERACSYLSSAAQKTGSSENIPRVDE